MKRWIGWGVLTGAVLGIVLSTIGWPPQAFLPAPKTNPEVLIWWSLGGGLIGFLGAAAVVGLWNTIVLPAWLLRHTTAPLAKVALGLGLLFNGMVLAVFNGLGRNVLRVYGIDEVQLAPGTGLTLPTLLDTVASLLAVFGPILCLEIAPKSRSSGVLLWAVVFQVSALVIGANPVLNEVKINKDIQFNLAALLTSAAVVLFLVFLRRLARTLERPDLEQRARSLLKGLAWCLGVLGAVVAAGAINSIAPRPATFFPALVALVGFILAICIIVISLRFFRLTRDFQTEITRRL
jgi:hypothetical protein